MPRRAAPKCRPVSLSDPDRKGRLIRPGRASTCSDVCSWPRRVRLTSFPTWLAAGPLRCMNQDGAAQQIGNVCSALRCPHHKPPSRYGCRYQTRTESLDYGYTFCVHTSVVLCMHVHQYNTWRGGRGMCNACWDLPQRPACLPSTRRETVEPVSRETRPVFDSTFGEALLTVQE